MRLACVVFCKGKDLKIGIMKYFICILFAYLIGSLSPSALIAKIMHKDLRKEGTGNLGATNTTLVLGKMFGFLVMVLDISKGFIAVKMSTWIIPDMEWFAMLVGFFAIIGHCFPFYLKFKGGKGLATFEGIILAYNPLFFLFEVITGMVFVLIVNSGTALSYYVAVVFPIYVAFTSKNIYTIAVCIIMSLFMMIIFIPNLKKAIEGREHKIRDFLKKQSSQKQIKKQTTKTKE